MATLRYRLHEPGDLPSVQRLWESHTSWGPLTEWMWRRYVLEPPFGGVTLVLAEDDAGELVGSFAFLPQLVSVDGREVRSCRPFAPIVAERARGRLVNPANHPVLGMYLHAVRALRERGDALIYVMPDPRWARFFRVLPWFRGAAFPLWQRPLPREAPLDLGPGFAAAPVAPDDARIDALWDAVRAQYRCAVVRDRRTLPWKIWSGEYEIAGVERGGELVGLAAARAKGDRQWLVCDVLAADVGPALRATLAAACNLGRDHAAAHPEAGLAKAAVLLPPAMAPAAEALGFARDAYDFQVAVQRLDDALPAEAVSPAHWYLSAND